MELLVEKNAIYNVKEEQNLDFALKIPLCFYFSIVNLTNPMQLTKLNNPE